MSRAAGKERRDRREVTGNRDRGTRRRPPGAVLASALRPGPVRHRSAPWPRRQPPPRHPPKRRSPGAQHRPSTRWPRSSSSLTEGVKRASSVRRRMMSAARPTSSDPTGRPSASAPPRWPGGGPRPAQRGRIGGGGPGQDGGQAHLVPQVEVVVGGRTVGAQPHPPTTTAWKK